MLLTSSLYLICTITYGGVAERGTLTGAALFTAEVALPPPVVQAAYPHAHPKAAATLTLRLQP